jgi:phage recombination protein Bet
VGTEVATSSSSSILEPARFGFDPKQVEAIRQSVAKDCTDAELVMFLEVCGRYKLDPFAKQVFAAKMKGGVQIIVSRDGLLAHAHKQPDFVNLDGDVVCQKDEFKMTFRDGERQVEHSYGDPTARGPIVGAWAMVERKGKGHTYFYAPLSEYKGNSPIWGKYPTAMILKVAESYALRKAFSISGVVGEEEVEALEPKNDLTAVAEPDWGDSEELAEELRIAVGQAQQAWPTDWRPAKVHALLNGATEEQRKALIDELSEKLTAETKRAAKVVDAEVVGEDE